MILKNLIYILQSENYYFKRFLKFAYTHLAWWKLSDRQEIVWTMKVQAIWILTVIFFWGVVFTSFVTFGMVAIFMALFLVLTLPFIIGMSWALLMPLDWIVKQRRIKLAEKILWQKRIKVIGIAGSYGKTSTKEILSKILEQKFKVIKTPGNVNTDIGIADFIIKNRHDFLADGIFIVEMGAYCRGEIRNICQMVHPAFSILTGINESHLERFGSLENIIQGKFELPQNTGQTAVLNFDDENIRKNWTRFELKNAIGISKDEAVEIVAKEKFSGLEFVWQGEKFETKLLAEHNITLILLCARIAKEFSLSISDIRAGVSKIEVVEHRLQPMYNANTNIMVIDDSYNGNVAGIFSGIELLKRATGRKVVLTPGLVELGSESEKIHRAIGELYAKNADLVLLIQSPATEYIAQGLKKNGFTNFKIYADTQKAHADLANILQRGDTIIFQNDLTDNYF